MRKFISLMSAAAMVAALVPSVAMAEDTVLYSNSFNGYPTSAKTADGSVFAVAEGTAAHAAAGTFQWLFNSPQSRTLDKLTVDATGSDDDTASIMINEKDAADKYISIPKNRFPSRCKPQIRGLDQYSANAGEALVISFKAMLTEGDQGAATLNMGDLGTLTSTELGTGEWKDVKFVTTDSSTTIYVDGTAVGDPVLAVPTVIAPVPFDEATKCSTYATVCIDDLVILSSADGAEATIPAAEDKELETEPEATDVPAAAEITDTVRIDFDETDFEAAGVTVSTNKANYEIAAIADGLGGNESKLLKIDQTSTDDNASNGGYFSVDISSITSGKSHIIIDYDFYTANNGRVKTIIADKIAAGSDGKISSAPTIINQGITGKGLINVLDGVWVHTKVDVDLATGIGTYEVVGPEENVIGSGKITTDLKTLTTIGFVSWSTNTSYIDNLAIATGGEIEVVTPTPVPTATPEPASEVEGSFDSKALVPADATWSNDFAAVEGEGSVVLNHSNANAIVAGDVNVYEEKVNYRGKSIYALYDVLVNAGDKVTLQLYNKTDLGTTFTLTGNEDGTATAAALVNKGDSVTVGNVVCGTWYRVLIEIPQNNNDGATNTGDATYTIYRIDSADPTKVSEVAVAKAGLTPRNLSGKAVTTLRFSVTGEPSFDNGAAFVTAGGLSLIEEAPATEAPATPEPASDVEGSFESKALAPENDWSTDFAAVEGVESVVLNHSKANAVAAGDVNVYEEKVNYRGKSIYAIYDVLVNAGDKVKLELYNKTDLGTTFVLAGNENGTATAEALVDKGDKVTVGKVVCGTWYRVLIEVPQNNNNGATNTGAATYTIYRIDKADPTKVSEVAVAKAGLTPRNLASKAVTTFRFSTEGTPSIDNGVAFVKAGGYVLEIPSTWYKYTATKENGVLKSVTMTAVDDPATETADPANGVYIWNQFLTPYVAPED